MTDNTPNTDTETETENTPTTQKTRAVNKPSSALPWGAILLSAAALGASGWTLYQLQLSRDNLSPLQSQIQALNTQQTNLNQQINTSLNQTGKIPNLEKALAAQQSSVTELQDALSKAEMLIAQQNDKILSTTQQLNRLSNTTKEDWKLAEAEYLIRLANQRLLMESDISGADNLLSTADQILSDMADPILFDTRKAIAKDIQALKATASFDLEGLFLQLDALTSQIDQLPQKEPSKEWQTSGQSATTSVESSTETATTNNTFVRVMGELWQSLRSLVVINYNHKPIKALLPAADYQELVSALKLQINVAQLALLKKENTIYQTSLNHVAEAITTHFDLQSKSVISFMTSITALQQVNPSPSLPLPRESLAAMKRLMIQWNALQTNSDNTEALTEANNVETSPMTESINVENTSASDTRTVDTSTGSMDSSANQDVETIPENQVMPSETESAPPTESNNNQTQTVSTPEPTTPNEVSQ